MEACLPMEAKGTINLQLSNMGHIQKGYLERPRATASYCLGSSLMIYSGIFSFLQSKN